METMKTRTYELKLYADSSWKEEGGLSKLEILLDDSRNECSDFADIGEFLEYGRKYCLTISVEATGDAAACSCSSEFLETPLTDKYVRERNFMGYNIAPDDVAFMRAMEQTYGKWRNRCSTAEASLKTLNLWKP